MYIMRTELLIYVHVALITKQAYLFKNNLQLKDYNINFTF